MSKFKVGQKIFVVISRYSRRAQTSHVKIEKIGTKWAYLESYYGRFDIKTGRLDGKERTSPGRVYATEADYLIETKLNEAWRSFQDDVRSVRLPEGLTTIKIERAREALGL